MKAIYLVALAAGTFSALQSAVNTRLAQYVGGPITSALISVIITGLALIPVALATKASFPAASSLSAVPWWAWTGGVIGALFLTTVIYSIQGLGVAGAISLVMAAQIVTSVAMDQLGVHGGTPVPLTVTRGLGCILLIAGVWLINRH